MKKIKLVVVIGLLICSIPVLSKLRTKTFNEKTVNNKTELVFNIENQTESNPKINLDKKTTGNKPDDNKKNIVIPQEVLNDQNNQNTEEKYLVTVNNSDKVEINESKKILPNVYELNSEEVKELKKDNHKVIVEKDEPVKLLLTPNDALVGYQHYNLENIVAWNLETGESTSTIAIIDTGIRGTHAELTGRVSAGWNYINNTAITANSNSDDNGHGTAMASAAVAKGNNSVGIAGVDWNAKLIPVKVLNSSGIGTTADAIRGITYAADQGADIINLSFGRTTTSQAMQDAVDYAWNKGSLIISATGNDGVAGVYYPAAYDNVIAVGSVNSAGAHSAFSNTGPEVDVVTPGESIYVAGSSTNSSYSYVSGTSVSAALASGSAALVFSRHPNASNQEVRDSLLQTTNKLSQNTNSVGKGRISTYNALLYIKNYRSRFVWQSGNPVLYPSQSSQMSVRFNNTGNSSWNPRGDYPVRLAVDYKDESGSQFKGSWTSNFRISPVSNQIQPGQNASFSFNITAPANIAPGDYRLSVRLVADGATWFDDGGAAWWKIIIPKPSAELVRQPGYPTLSRGQDATVQVKFRNTTGLTWNASGALPTRLAVDKYWSDRTAWKGSGWLSDNRISTPIEGTVTNGSIATFNVPIHVPVDMPSGTHRFYVRLVTDGYAWFDNPDYNGAVWWDIRVR